MGGRYRSWALGLIMCLLSAMALTACSAGNQAVISAEMSDFKFTPSSWEVPAGTKVTLSLTNSGAVTHSWTLMEGGYIAKAPFSQDDAKHELQSFTVKPGQSDTFEFTSPSSPGNYQVVCSQPGHLDAGMKGTLIVK